MVAAWGGVYAVAAGFKAVDFDRGVVEESVEHADCVGSAAHAGGDAVGKFAGGFKELFACFGADGVVEETYHG